MSTVCPPRSNSNVSSSGMVHSLSSPDSLQCASIILENTNIVSHGRIAFVCLLFPIDIELLRKPLSPRPTPGLARGGRTHICFQSKFQLKIFFIERVKNLSWVQNILPLQSLAITGFPAEAFLVSPLSDPASTPAHHRHSYLG